MAGLGNATCVCTCPCALGCSVGPVVRDIASLSRAGSEAFPGRSLGNAQLVPVRLRTICRSSPEFEQARSIPPRARYSTINTENEVSLNLHVI